MGISKSHVEYLFHIKKYRVNFEKVASLARQGLFVLPEEMKQSILKYENTVDVDNALSLIYENIDKVAPAFVHVYSDGLFKYFGAKTVESFDYSSYENATKIYDMNLPIPEQEKNKYTLVYDGGTLEHIYNFNVAYKNAMDMVEIGGHLLLNLPGNNAFSHGFYQFSPELFFSTLTKENGFELIELLILNGTKWYKVSNPYEIKSRVEVIYTGKTPVMLVVLAKKIAQVPDIIQVQQSDYELVWNGESSDSVNSERPFFQFGKKIYSILPKGIALKLSRFATVITQLLADLDRIFHNPLKDKKYYQKIKLNKN